MLLERTCSHDRKTFSCVSLVSFDFWREMRKIIEYVLECGCGSSGGFGGGECGSGRSSASGGKGSDSGKVNGNNISSNF